ncbi:MAG TPA: DUF4010 domain-containing protein [Pseudolabrys sp.]|nr:DUF4010 domain-containing protein [Pseudolabrys sp.]
MLHWALLRLVAPPLVAATVVAVTLSLLPLRWRTGRNNKAAQRTAFRNPFAFWSVVGFAIFLGIIVVAGRAISERAGATGAILGAAAMGIADVDAITVSIASLGSRVLSDQSAAFAILSAVATNMLAKLVIGAAIGSGSFALYLGIVSLACFAAAGIALWLTLFFLPL